MILTRISAGIAASSLETGSRADISITKCASNLVSVNVKSPDEVAAYNLVPMGVECADEVVAPGVVFGGVDWSDGMFSTSETVLSAFCGTKL